MGKLHRLRPKHPAEQKGIRPLQRPVAVVRKAQGLTHRLGETGTALPVFRQALPFPRRPLREIDADIAQLHGRRLGRFQPHQLAERQAVEIDPCLLYTSRWV